MDPAAHDASHRFLVDGMAVRVGKYLRCLGYDATWHEGEPTRVLARRADAEDRVFLTCNTRLGEDVVRPRRHLLLTGDDPVEHVRQVLRAFDLDPRPQLFTRCIRCNVELLDAPAELVAQRVPECVRERHLRFFTCPRCGTVFWRGTHVVNTCTKLGLPGPSN